MTVTKLNIISNFNIIGSNISFFIIVYCYVCNTGISIIYTVIRDCLTLYCIIDNSTCSVSCQQLNANKSNYILIIACICKERAKLLAKWQITNYQRCFSFVIFFVLLLHAANADRTVQALAKEIALPIFLIFLSSLLFIIYLKLNISMYYCYGNLLKMQIGERYL